MLKTAKSYFPKLRATLALGVMAAALSACGTTNWGFPYRADVQQGNWITSEQVAQLRKGMTREIAIMARGYPPAHETSSLESDRWVYWSSRFVKLTVVFSNGRLSDGRGLY